ncbi:MAG: hypothetical protein NTV92_03700 [Candidatus Bipolaricaulota bacterium]|nr:hypothetical protein [Candidatus Bipolaricaulota bacterium]
MSVRSVLTKAAVRDLARSRSYVVAFTVISAFFVAILYVIGVRLLITPLFERPVLDRELLAAAVTGLVYCTVLIITGLSLNISSTQPLIRGKASGSIESLLATPVAARDLWFALSIASILPGILAGVGAGVVGAVVLGVVYLTPNGIPIATPWTILNCFVLLPSVYLMLAFLVHAVGVPGRPTSGAVIAQVFLPGYSSLIINLGARDVLAVTRLDLALVQLGLTVVLAGILAATVRGVTKERIVLSCKR